MRLSVVFFALLQVNAAAALPTHGTFRVKESIHSPRGWSESVAPLDNHTISLRIALAQPNFAILEQHLWEVSDPDHARYGNHLGKEEVEKIVAPSAASIALVDRWLASHGLKETDFVRSPAKDWLTVRLPVRTVENMLDTVSAQFQHYFYYSLSPHLRIPSINFRNTVCGSTRLLESLSFERRATASRRICTTTLMSSSRRLSLHACDLQDRLFLGRAMLTSSQRLVLELKASPVERRLWPMVWKSMHRATPQSPSTVYNRSTMRPDIRPLKIRAALLALLAIWCGVSCPGTVM